MSLQLRQNLKLAQQMRMTPELRQAIKLLQLSRLELVDQVQEALLENPMLEERQDEEIEESQEQEKLNEGLQEFLVEEDNLLKNAEWEDYLGYFSSSSRQLSEREIPEDMVSYEATYAAKTSLSSHLQWQLQLSDFDQEEKGIGNLIIGNLDEHGYLSVTLDEILDKTNYSREKAESVLRRIQYFDPVGIASRSLQECLCVQLAMLDEQDPILLDLVKNHLSELENNNLQGLAKKLGISFQDLQAYIDIIKSLDPRPGSSYNSGETFYVSPDAFVYNYDDQFVIILNEDGLPDLHISPYYLKELAKQAEHKDFFRKKMREALWLLKSINQRQRTLYKVIESIVGFQRDFFESGLNHLKPLVLKDVADDVEVHESTVSRITSNKFISTPFGIYELKYFFNSGLGIDGGGQVASETVKSFIKKIISSEDERSPKSDKEIVSMLNKHLKVNIARRTVAKYRESMLIPSSTKRKKVF